MEAYAYQAALYCEDCGKQIINQLGMEGKEDTGDSDDYPKGPYADGGGEADSPQHCDGGDTCLNHEDGPGGTFVGAFLDNPLTSEGTDYVVGAILDNLKSGRHDSIAVTIWAEAYELDTVAKLAEAVRERKG